MASDRVTGLSCSEDDDPRARPGREPALRIRANCSRRLRGPPPPARGLPLRSRWTSCFRALLPASPWAPQMPPTPSAPIQRNHQIPWTKRALSSSTMPSANPKTSGCAEQQEPQPTDNPEPKSAREVHRGELRRNDSRLNRLPGGRQSLPRTSCISAEYCGSRGSARRRERSPRSASARRGARDAA